MVEFYTYDKFPRFDGENFILLLFFFGLMYFCFHSMGRLVKAWIVQKKITMMEK